MRAPATVTAPEHTGSRGSRILGALALAGIVALVPLALVVSPEDVTQLDAVRLMYVHVPSAITMFVGFAITAGASAMWLWKRTRGWDTLAAASAEIGLLFTGLCLLTGMLWGRPTWGVYWVWDARLTSTALLFLLYLGYLVVRRLPAEAELRNKRSAFVALLAFVDVPIVHYSVDWWRSLHQEATITKLDPSIEGMQLFTLMLGLVVFGLIYAWLLVHRFRVAWLEDQAAEHSLDAALAERRSEAELEPVP